MQAGLNYIEARLTRAELDIVEQRPLDYQLTYMVIGRNGNTTDVAFGQNFICDLPATREYQSALDEYVSAVAGRARCGDPDAFYCSAGICIRVEVMWPIRIDGLRQWLIVKVFDPLEGSLARCTVNMDSFEYLTGRPTFAQLSLVINRLRKAIDEHLITLFPPEKHPLNYQQIQFAPSEATVRTESEVQQFILGKAYVLGFQASADVGQIWVADPWDAEYLGVSVNQLIKAAQVLRARGFIDIAPAGAFARPSDKLVASGPVSASPSAVERSEVCVSLSGLPRKEQLLEEIKDSLMSKAGVAILVIDLDRFKEVNDTKGHSQGDVCLEQVVKIISEAVGKKGTLFRWGGDEFAVLLPDFSTNEAQATAERVRSAVEAARPGGEVAVTTSIGVCGSDLVDSPSEQRLFDAADRAMYESKRNGRNRVTAWPITERQATAANASR